MPFQPEVDQELVIDGVAYRVAAHPASPSMVYGQEGRQGTVYQLASTADRRALKVFKPRHRVPAMVTLADHLASFADLPGLAVCQRVVLSARRHTELLRQYPDLTYAVLMPWIAGPTWFEVIVDKRELAAAQCLGLARSFLGVLTAMEERGVAHCDLSGPNVVLPVFAEPATADSRADVALVDVEGLFGPGLERPEVVLGGSSGYAQRFTTAEAWDAKADRFTGALLLGEMLGWCDEWVRQGAWGESYFDPQEVQTDAARYYRLVTTLREHWGEEVVSLFERAWHSQSLADCPTFGEWLLALPDLPVEAKPPGKGEGIPLATAPLLAQAQSQEESGDLAGAIATYEQIVEQVAATSGIAEEIRLILPQMREKQARQTQLAQRVDEARDHEANERWQAAAAHYEGLLGETDLTPEQRTAWELDLVRCQNEVTLAGLFDTAMVAMAQDRWEEARSGLRDLTQRRPDGYIRNGVTAQSVLDSAEKHLAPNQWRPRRAMVLGSAGALVALAAVLLMLGGNQRATAQTATTTATVTAVSAVQTISTASAQSTASGVTASPSPAAPTTATPSLMETATVVAQITADAAQVAATTRLSDTATAIAGASVTVEAQRFAAAQVSGSQTAVAQTTNATATSAPPSPTEPAPSVAPEPPTAAPVPPTATPVVPTSTPFRPPTSVPRPTSVPPTAIPTAAPSIVAPVLAGSSSGSGSLVLSWSYGGQLGPNDYFDVRVWQAGQPANGIANTKQTAYTIGGSFPAGTYNWTIAVINKDGGTVTTLAQASQTLSFTWSPAGGGGGASGGGSPPIR